MRQMNRSLGLMLSLSLLLSTGCSYISTMDPGDNSRLAALKEESRQEVLAGGSAMTLKAFQQNVEALKSPRLIFRTHLQGDGIILEAFTNPGDIKGTLDSVFNHEPELLDRVTIVNGKRGELDFLPDLLLPEDPSGLRFSVQLESISGQFHDHATVTLEQGSGNAAEMLYAEIRQLLLVGESLPREPEGTYYRISLVSTEGQPLGELILDDGQTLHARTPEGDNRTYLLMNLSQWSGLKARLDRILEQKEEEEEGPVTDAVSLGFDLPWTERDALIGQASAIIEDDEEPKQILYLEAAVVGRISPNMTDLTLEDEFSAIWLMDYEVSEDGERYMTGYSESTLNEAQQLAGEWGFLDEVADLTSRILEEARYNFLIQVKERGLFLDPDAEWR